METPNEKIILIPLDDRPCNTSFVKRVIQISGFKVLLPDTSLLGKFTTPGDPDSIIRWLESIDTDISALILSANMLCFGGLVASRTNAVKLDTAVKRLNSLINLRKKLPDSFFFLFDVIMRLTISGVSEESLKWYHKLFRLMILRSKLQTVHNKKELKEYNSLLAELPPKLVDDYLKVRERNHAINEQSLELLSKGIVNFLILAQEDTAEYGPHVDEQKILKGFISEHNLKDRVTIHPGTDEAALSMAARAANQIYNLKPKVYVEYSTKDGENIVPIYEDRPLKETIPSHLFAANCEMTCDLDDNDLILLVNTGPCGDPFSRGFDTSRKRVEVIQSFVRFAAELLDAGKNVAIADTAYCNSADPVLVEELQKSGIIYRLAAYAGWNTAANTLGTAISHACAYLIAKGSDNPVMKQNHAEFLYERFIDDWGYQCVTRTRINLWIREILKGHPYNLEDLYDIVNTAVSDEMYKISTEFFNTNFKGRDILGQKIIDLEFFTTVLPWNRTFEVKIDAKFKFE